jgi:hypothetical protein
MMEARVLAGGKHVCTVRLDAELPEGLTLADLVLSVVNNPIEVKLSGGDVSRLRESGRLVSFVMSRIDKEPACVSPST